MLIFDKFVFDHSMIVDNCRTLSNHFSSYKTWLAECLQLISWKAIAKLHNTASCGQFCRLAYPSLMNVTIMTKFYINRKIHACIQRNMGKIGSEQKEQKQPEEIMWDSKRKSLAVRLSHRSQFIVCRQWSASQTIFYAPKCRCITMIHTHFSVSNTLM